MPLQDDFQREKKRSILLVGLSIILLALTVSPVGPFLTSSPALLATFWVIYALGMIIYFSDDLFHPRTRRTAKVIGLTCFFVYPVGQKKPLGQAPPRKTPSQSETPAKTLSEDSDSKPSS